MPNPLSYQQVLALSKGLNFFYLEDGRSNPITFNPIDSKILLSDSGILLAEKTSLVQIKTFELASVFGRQNYGLGNPIKVAGEYPSVYNIKKCNDSTIKNGLKFSYFDYFGDPALLNRPTSEQGFFFNTEDGELAPEAWMQVEQNYINNDHIVSVYAFKDVTTNTDPFTSGGALNTAWTGLSNNTVCILSLGNRNTATVDDGFFVQLVGGGDNFILQKANGTIDTIGARNSECDSFVFDPFNGPVFPTGRLNNVGDDYEDEKPADYLDRITSMEPYGSWDGSASFTLSTPVVLNNSNWVFEGSAEEAQVFRFTDADIYTNGIQRCNDPFSIDNIFPFFPYSKTTGSNNSKFNDMGGIDGTLTVLKNATTQYWEQNLAGTMVSSGQGGFSNDKRSATSTFRASLSTKNSQISSIYSNSFGGFVSSLYELVDTQRRAVASPAGTFGVLDDIEFYKAPYFDFTTEEVKGSSKQKVSCGFFSAFFVDVSGIIDAPQNVYSNVDALAFSMDMTQIVRNVFTNREIRVANPYLVDTSTATTTDLAFANGSFASTINAALTGEDIKKVCGYQNEIAWINKAGIVKYAGFNSNMENVFTLDEEALDVALNKNTNSSARRFAVKLNPSGVITVADGATGISAITDLVNGTPNPSPKGSYVSVDAGFDHAITLRADGAAFAWGTNTSGQTSVPAGIFFKSVKAHGNYSCGIDTNNVFRAWGSVSGTVSNALDYWVGPTFVVVKKPINVSFGQSTGNFSYTILGSAPSFVTNFFNTSVNYLNVCFTDTYLIAETTEKENYIVTAGSSPSISGLPSTTSFQDLAILHAAQNYSLVVGQDGVKAPLKEIYSKDIDEDGVNETDITYTSIDQASDVALVTLDSDGAVRILYVNLQAIGTNTATGLNNCVYFGKEDLLPYLTDDTGQVPQLAANEGFVKVVACGGYDRRPCVVWLLHSNGSVYGVELTTSINRDVFGRYYKADTQSPQFGLNFTYLGDNFTRMQIDLYSNCYPPNTLQPGSTGGSRLFIKCALNKIPKDSNGRRFPVIDLFGSYATYGGCVCANTKYNGNEAALIPYQEPEIVLFPPVGCLVSPRLNAMLSKLQQRKVTLNADGTGVYTDNPEFNRDFYNEVFAIIQSGKGDPEIIYAPPRNVSYARSPFISASAADFTGSNPSLVILGNNGNLTILAAPNSYVAFTAPNNLSTFSTDLATKKFTKTNASFTHPAASTIFNRGTPELGVLQSTYLKPQYVSNPSQFLESVAFDIDTGASGGSGIIVIPGLSFDGAPSGFQQFYIDQGLVGRFGGDFNLDGEVSAVEKQLHNTGTKILKKLK